MTYPEHEKLQVVQALTQAVADFLEFAATQDHELHYTPQDGTRGACCASIPLSHLLARWQEIDLDALEQEKRQMLHEARQSC